MTDNATPMPGTALPWQIVLTPHATGHRRNIVDAKRREIAVASSTPNVTATDANAAYIVWAANNAPALMDALKGWIDYIDAPGSEEGDGAHEEHLLEAMRTAITSAGGRNG